MWHALRDLSRARRAPAGGRRRRPRLAVEQLERRDTPSKVSLAPVASVRITGGPAAGTQEVVFAIDAGHKLFAQVETLSASGQFVGTPNGWRQIGTGVKSVDAFETVNGQVGVLAVETTGALLERLAVPTALTNASWTQIGAGVQSVFAGGTNTANREDIFTIDASGRLFEKQATPGALATGSWTQIASGIKQVAADFNATANKMDILALDDSGKLFEQQEGATPATAGGFNQIATGIKQVAVAFNPFTTNKADIFALDEGGKLFEQQEGTTPATAGAWRQIGTGDQEVAAAADALTGRTDIFVLGGKKGKLVVLQEGATSTKKKGIGKGVTFVNVPFGGTPGVYAEDSNGNLFEQSPTLKTNGTARYDHKWTLIGTGIEQTGKSK